MVKIAPAFSTDAHEVAPEPLRCVDPTVVSGWDARIAQLGGSVFHTTGWANVLKETYGYHARYLVGGTKSALSILPLMEVDSWLTGRRGICLPFTDECGALGANRETFERLFNAAVALGHRRKWKSLELRGSSDLLDTPLPSLTFYGHALDLTAEADLLARIDAANRRAIRRAAEKGVSVEFSTSREAMAAFYRLLCLTRQRHGLPPQPKRFFDQIQSAILAKSGGAVALARVAGRPIAGAVYLHSGSTVLYKFGASDLAFQEFRANNLVMWEAIRLYQSRGFSRLDFGRTSLSNDGLRRFKLSWGTAERVVPYVKYDLRSARFVADRDESTGWHSPVFRALPRPVARLMGALLYKHIA